MNSVNKPMSMSNLLSANTNANTESAKVNTEGFFAGKSVEIEPKQVITPNPSNSFFASTKTLLSNRSAEESIPSPHLKAIASGATKLSAINT